MAQTPPPAIKALGFTRRPSSAAARALTMHLCACRRPARLPGDLSRKHEARLRILCFRGAEVIGGDRIGDGFLISLLVLFAMKLETLFSHVADESLLPGLRLFSFFKVLVHKIM